MALSQLEQEKVDQFTFSYLETYRRMVKFYKDYLNEWQNLSNDERTQRLGSRGFDVNQSAPFILALPDESNDLLYVLEIAQLVRSSNYKEKCLEFAYHKVDEYGIKLGMYAEYLLKQFEILKGFS